MGAAVFLLDDTNHEESGVKDTAQGRGLVVLSKESWSDTRWARKQWLPYWLAMMGGVRQVVYVNRHRAWWRGEKAEQDNRGCEHIDVKQFGLMLPLERCPWVRAWNRRRIGKRIASLLDDQLDWRCLFYHPYDFQTAREIAGQATIVFDWTEDWADFHADAALAKLQIEAIAGADAVITVTETLQERARAIRGDEQVFLLPNATSFEPGAGGAGDETAIPEAVPHPRIAYVGHLGPWFDCDLVEALAIRRPDWSWVMVGGVSDAVRRRLGPRGNVHLLGIHVPESLPAVMRQCDVLVAPYRPEFTGDATKLYDYLTVARPILSIPCDTARRLHACVETAVGADEWEARIETMLGQPGINENCLAMAGQHHWKARVETFLSMWDAMKGGRSG
ncbi:MAG: glycosyltransferase [Mariprofundaceae bacterium]|nr:glycosyltransferase [Mariprofundaceae bacterium]